MTDIAQTLPSHWRYVSEGGATIVFSYVGPANPAYDGMVLRLRKAANILDQGGANSDEDEADDPIIEYQTRCMEQLFPRENLPRLQSIRLKQKWLEDLAELHDVKRPEARIKKDHVDFSRKKGVLATDLVGGDWISVEIKPKWGFLPSSTHLSEETKKIKTRTCRFCMHSYMRHLKNHNYVNNYCPLDLFSGNATRVRTAIDSLWDAWEHSRGGVNNLKIFARGQVVTSDHIECMLHKEVADQVSPDGVRDIFKDTLCQTLLHSPVLAILSKLQRTLDALDIEGLSKLWHEAELQSPLYQSTHAAYFQQPLLRKPTPPATPLGVPSVDLPSPEPSIPDWVEFLDRFQSPEMEEMDHTHPRIENLRYYMLAYLLSATFKDCSLIVRLDFLKPGSSSQETHPIAVIDLDPKSLDKLRQWEELDREIVAQYQPDERKVCVDRL